MLLEHEMEKLQIVNDYAFRETNLVIEQKNRIERELAVKITDNLEEMELLNQEIERLKRQVDDTKEATSFLVDDKQEEIYVLEKEKMELEKKSLELELIAHKSAAEVKRVQAEQVLKDKEISSLQIKIADYDALLKLLEKHRDDLSKLQAQKASKDAEIEVLQSQLTEYDVKLSAAQRETEGLKAKEYDALLKTMRVVEEEQGEEHGKELRPVGNSPIEVAAVSESEVVPAVSVEEPTSVATPPPKPARPSREMSSVSTKHSLSATPLATPKILSSADVSLLPCSSRPLEKFMEWFLHCGFDVVKLCSKDVSVNSGSVSSVVRKTFSGSPSKVLPFGLSGRSRGGGGSPLSESSKKSQLYKLKLDINGNVLLLDGKFMSTILTSKKKNHITDLLKVTKLPVSNDDDECMTLCFKGQVDQTVLQLVDDSALNKSFDASLSLDSFMAYLNALLNLNAEGPMSLQILLSKVA